MRVKKERENYNFLKDFKEFIHTSKEAINTIWVQSRVSLRFHCTGALVRGRCDSQQLMRDKILCLCIRVCTHLFIDSIERRNTHRGKKRSPISLSFSLVPYPISPLRQSTFLLLSTAQHQRPRLRNVFY